MINSDKARRRINSTLAALFVAFVVTIVLFSCATNDQGFGKRTKTKIAERTIYENGVVVAVERGVVEKSKLKIKAHNKEFVWATGSGSGTVSYDFIGGEFIIHLNGEHEGEANIPVEAVEAVGEGITTGLVSIVKPSP